MNIYQQIPSPVEPDTWIGIDTEWFQMNPKQLHRPTSGKFACLSIAVGEDVYVVQNEQDVATALYAIGGCVWCFHNMKFDITQLRRIVPIPPRKKMWDVMLMDRILHNGMYDTWSLKDISRRELDVILSKEARDLFEGASEMTPEMIEYSAKDPYNTLKIALKQKREASTKDFALWKNVDLPCLWAVLDFKGFPIDVEEWKSLATINKQKADAIADTLPFSPNQYAKIKALFASKGTPIESSDEDHLSEYIDKHPNTELSDIATRILESRMYGRRASTYGTGFIEDFLETDPDGTQVIYSNFNIIGAETGRFSSSDPNVQNIPIRETKEFRQCFISRPGYVLIVLDYYAQEPCITAYITQDKKLISIFKEKIDVYVGIARDVFGETIQKSDPRRKEMKPLFLGAAYGLTKYGLAAKEKIDLDLAEEFLSKFFDTYKGVTAWANKQRTKRKYVETVLGRKFWLNPYSGQVENNALNAPIQGSAADVTKLAIASIHQNWHFKSPFGIIAPIHDELVVEALEEEAEEIAKFCADIMVKEAETMCPGIPFSVDCSIGKSWSCKK